MNRTTVMHLRGSLGLYGAERVILNLASRIDKERFNLIILCLREPDGKSEDFVRRASALQVPVACVDVHGRLDVRAIQAIRAIIRSRNVTIVHSHDFKSNLYALLATIGLSVKRVATAHGTTKDSLMRRAYLFVDERFLYRRFDAIVAVAGQLRNRLVGFLDPDRVSLIQNGIDAALVETEAAAAAPPLPPPDGRKTFAVIGRLLPDKGHRFFLDAFAEVLASHPDVAALFVGDGPEARALASRIEALGLADAVCLCGTRADMQNVYRRIDYLVIPSLTEGLPNVLLEAFAWKVPILATRVGDIPALVRDGHSGYLVPPGDSPALAKGMKALLDHPDTARAMAEEGHCILQRGFTACRMARDTESLYERVLQG